MGVGAVSSRRLGATFNQLPRRPAWHTTTHDASRASRRDRQRSATPAARKTLLFPRAKEAWRKVPVIDWEVIGFGLEVTRF